MWCHGYKDRENYLGQLHVFKIRLKKRSRGEMYTVNLMADIIMAVA